MIAKWRLPIADWLRGLEAAVGTEPTPKYDFGHWTLDVGLLKREQGTFQTALPALECDLFALCCNRQSPMGNPFGCAGFDGALYRFHLVLFEVKFCLQSAIGNRQSAM